MFILIRLYLAHCLADFPFQTNFIFRLKQRGGKGVLLHALIVVLCCLMLSWPFLTIPQLLGFIALIGISHFIQDTLKLKFSNPGSQFWLYILDQLFHLGVIALILFTGLKNLHPPPDITNSIARFYSNDQLMLLLIVLILVTYNGYFLIESFKISFRNGAGKQDGLEKRFGMFERALIASSFISGDHILLLLPLALLLRPLVFLLLKNKLDLTKNFISTSEILLSWSIGLLGGSMLFFF